MVGLIDGSMGLRAHEHIVCSDCRFRYWLAVLSGMRETVMYKDAEGQEKKNGCSGLMVNVLSISVESETTLGNCLSLGHTM